MNPSRMRRGVITSLLLIFTIVKMRGLNKQTLRIGHRKGSGIGNINIFTSGSHVLLKGPVSIQFCTSTYCGDCV